MCRLGDLKRREGGMLISPTANTVNSIENFLQSRVTNVITKGAIPEHVKDRESLVNLEKIGRGLENLAK